jgi:hypothetical protein
MISYTTSIAWSRPVFSPCYTEYGQRCDAVLLGRITTVAMCMSGQLNLSARLTSASVTRDRTLDTCEPSCVPEAAMPFFIFVVHNPLGSRGTWQHRSSPLGEARLGPHGSTGAHLDREARSVAEEHVAASKLSSRGGRVRSHGTRGSAGAYLDREARSGAEEHVASPELNSARRRGLGPWDT